MAVTLGRLRRDVGGQIGDVLVGTATATGTTSSFIDTVTLTGGDNRYRGRDAIVVSATNPANVGTIRYVTGSDEASSTITVRPTFSTAPVAGDIIELYNMDSGGPRISDIHRAINRAIRNAGPNALVGVVSDDITFDSAAPTQTIDADWYGFLDEGVRFLNENDNTWHPVPWRNLDKINRTVIVARSCASWLHGKTIRLYGCELPSELATESSTTEINPEWLANMACYYLLRETATKRSTTAQSTALAFAQTFRDEAAATRNLTRNRVGPYHKLGTA